VAVSASVVVLGWWRRWRGLRGRRSARGLARAELRRHGRPGRARRRLRVGRGRRRGRRNSGRRWRSRGRSRGRSDSRWRWRDGRWWRRDGRRAGRSPRSMGQAPRGVWRRAPERPNYRDGHGGCRRDHDAPSRPSRAARAGGSLDRRPPGQRYRSRPLNGTKQGQEAGSIPGGSQPEERGSQRPCADQAGIHTNHGSSHGQMIARVSRKWKGARTRTTTRHRAWSRATGDPPSG
jgi:hypothetical protein